MEAVEIQIMSTYQRHHQTKEMKQEEAIQQIIIQIIVTIKEEIPTDHSIIFEVILLTWPFVST